ncbi:hypothetical protein VTP01DRAFT_4679 [Rhizomucor pusillus]|uniref:uncharacterized protein n=1 Tax=Rhizomucor pusillus TaxID=4840 RepID=UPI0037435EDE
MTAATKDYWSQLSASMVDQVIGDEYQLLEELGRGSYGCLFLGQSLKDGSYVAVKILTKMGLDQNQLQVQQQEADIQSSLKHPHILSLHRVIQNQDFIFMVMELCDQGDLFDFVVRDQETNPIRDEKLVKTIFGQILDAMEYMHSRGVYHRDIKLENILLKADDDEDIVCKVADFGLATRDHLSIEFGCGSSTYLAPEHFDDDQTDMMRGEELLPYDAAKSDVWSLGILLIALLFGRNPWQEATSVDASYAEFKRNPTMLKAQLFPDMSLALFRFLKNVLSLDASDRPSVSEMKQQFQAINRLTDVDEEPLSPVDIPVTTKPQERASFDSAVFSGADYGSWSDMVEEEEEMQKAACASDHDEPEVVHNYDDDDMDMFVHSQEKESWWL